MVRRSHGDAFSPLVSLGRTAPEDRLWRRRYPQIHPSVRRSLIFSERPIQRWWHDLEGSDIDAGLRAARYLGHIIARHEERVVRLARAHGWGWEGIAWSLGVSRQAASMRWAARIRQPPAIDISDVRWS